MKKAVVTGAAGFIGSALTRRLVQDGVETHAFVRPGSDLQRLTSIGAHIHEMDLTQPTKVRDAIMGVPGAAVFHLAASNIMSGMAAPTETLLATNVAAVSTLLDSAIESGARSFVSTGSFLEYGAKDIALSEEMRCDPPEIYSITKLAGTLLVQDAAAKGLPTIVFRLFTPYGPGLQKGRLVYEVIAKALRNEPISLTRPTVTRDFIFVEDVVDALLEAAARAEEYAGQIFNLGSGDKTSLKELGELVLERTGSESELMWGGAQTVAYDTDTWQADMHKTFTAFAWRPKHSLSAGIDETRLWLEREV